MRLWILIVGLIFYTATFAWAGPQISNLEVHKKNGYLLMNCQLGGDIPYKYLDETLKHGISLRVTFYIVLTRIRTLLRDQVILEEQVNRLIYYQAVKNDYLIQYVGATIPPQNFSSLKEALTRATTLKNLPLLPLSQLSPSPYRIKVKVVLSKEVSIPFPFTIPLRLLHFLFGSGKIESNWGSLDFRL